MSATRLSAPVEGFRLAYERSGGGAPVVLLHGWPGDRHDFRLMAPRLAEHADVVVPDLRGFGQSDRHLDRGPAPYGTDGQVASVLGLLDELELSTVILAGYDVGSRVAQAFARAHPQRVRSMVLSPPMPGVGRRILGPSGHEEYWYQHFHRSPLVEELLDGRRDAVRAYLEYFWSHWSGSAYQPEPRELDRLADLYARPGAMTASIAYYRAGAGTVALALAETTPDERVTVPLTVLWPGDDALYPAEWSDRLGDFYADVTMLRAPGSGHFTPVEAPDAFVDAVLAALPR